MNSLRAIDLWVLFLWMTIDAIVVFRRGGGAVSREDRFSMQAIVLATWVGPVVAIQADHRVVDTGLYRHVRHPSYLGACIAFAGFGLGLGSWLGALFLVGMALLAYAYRIHVEEKALLASLGDAYAAYSRRTYRLIPGLY